MTKFENSRIKGVDEANADAQAIADRIRDEMAAEALDRQNHPTAVLFDNAREASIMDVAGAIMRRLRPAGDNFPYAGLEALLSNADASAIVNAFRNVSSLLSRAHRQEYDQVLLEQQRALRSELEQLRTDGFAKPPQGENFAMSVGCLLQCLSNVQSGNIYAAEDKFICAVQSIISACADEG